MITFCNFYLNFFFSFIYFANRHLNMHKHHCPLFFILITTKAFTPICSHKLVFFFVKNLQIPLFFLPLSLVPCFHMQFFTHCPSPHPPPSSVYFLMTWEAVANERQKVKWVWIFSLSQPSLRWLSSSSGRNIEFFPACSSTCPIDTLKCRQEIVAECTALQIDCELLGPDWSLLHLCVALCWA